MIIYGDEYDSKEIHMLMEPIRSDDVEESIIEQIQEFFKYQLKNMGSWQIKTNEYKEVYLQLYDFDTP
jgi:hypothetical protein